MKKLFSLTLFLLCAVMAFAQSPDLIPEEYGNEYQRIKDRAEKHEQDPRKIVLDPIEQVPVGISKYSVEQNGNWGYSYLEIDQFSNEIQQRADRVVYVFIFDTGIQRDHPALQGVIDEQLSKNFTDEKAFYDGNGHGTHCAGIVAARHPLDFYNIGVAGPLVKKNKLKLVDISVLHDEGYGYTSWIENGIKYANQVAKNLIQQGHGVVYSMSLGAQVRENEVFNAAIKEAENIGVITFAASGNANSFVAAPANGASAHAIGALTPESARAGFSNYGPELYLAAPGYRILSTYKDKRYVELSGTSMACPHQAGIAAILLSIYPNATARQISHFMAENTVDLLTDGWDQFTGFGVSKFSAVGSGDPTTLPDIGNGNPGEDTPDEERPTREKRELTYHLNKWYTVLWKPVNESSWRTNQIYFDVEFESDLFAEDAFDEVRIATDKYFQNRGLILDADQDMVDAAYWSRHFYEMILDKREGLDFEMINLMVMDNSGRVIYVPEKLQGSKLNQWFIKLFSPAIRVVDLK